MIFEPAERILLPTKDLLSYIFDDPPYDQDQPVSLEAKNLMLHHVVSCALGIRSTSTFKTSHAQSHAIRLES